MIIPCLFFVARRGLLLLCLIQALAPHYELQWRILIKKITRGQVLKLRPLIALNLNVTTPFKYIIACMVYSSKIKFRASWPGPHCPLWKILPYYKGNDA